jgi:hydrogenase expression/formation protein HypE
MNPADGASAPKRRDLAGQLPGGACPLPIGRYPEVTMAHGGGGRLMHALVSEMFLKAFGEGPLGAPHDGAVVDAGGKRVAFTTDSYVVKPLFFPGGDIGRLAVFGTVNDLAMCGARPLALSVGLILEEGLPMETLGRIAASLAGAAREAGVPIVTGDTKVVDRGRGDGVYVNTAGVGLVEHGHDIGPGSIRPGDAVILSGDVGRHGMAVMAVREGLKFETPIESDAAPLWGAVRRLLDSGVAVHCLRDLTRGGLATALNELASGAGGAAIELSEALVPVREEVRGACEVLGLDPLYVANEGRFVAVVPAGEAGKALKALKAEPVSAGAVVAGRVTAGSGDVSLVTTVGTSRVLDMLSGEQLPRIC